jgi:SAM-dependent methyltransferase
MVSHFGIGMHTHIADFGCGPGLYTIRFAETNARVTGIDFSARSIQYAKDAAQKKGLDIDYVCQDYLDFKTEKRFDLITMIMCDYCALSPMQREKILAMFYELLRDGGSVLLDVYSLNAFNQRKEVATYEFKQLNGFWSSGDYYGFLNTCKYEQEKVILDKYTIIEAAGIKTIYNWYQYFSKETLRKEFEEGGFGIAEYYSDIAGADFSPEANELAIVAKKTIK